MNKTLKLYKLLAVSTLVLSIMGIAGGVRAEEASGHGWEATATNSQPMHGYEATADSVPAADAEPGWESWKKPLLIAEIEHGNEATAEPNLVVAVGHGWEADGEPTAVGATGYRWELGSQRPATSLAGAPSERNVTTSRGAELSGSASEDIDRSPGLEVDGLQVTTGLTLAFLVGAVFALTFQHLRMARR